MRNFKTLLLGPSLTVFALFLGSSTSHAGTAGFAYEDATEAPLRYWADPVDFPQEKLHGLSQLIKRENVYAKAKAIMGGKVPCPDGGVPSTGGSPALDIYLVDRTHPMPDRILPYIPDMDESSGVSARIFPYKEGCGVPTLIIVDIKARDFLMTLVHEIFHLECAPPIRHFPKT